jgi:hypothetical protein
MSLLELANTPSLNAKMNSLNLNGGLLSVSGNVGAKVLNFQGVPVGGGGGGAVASVNAKVGAVQIVAGTNMTVDNTGATIVLNATGGAGGILSVSDGQNPAVVGALTVVGAGGLSVVASQTSPAVSTLTLTSSANTPMALTTIPIALANQPSHNIIATAQLLNVNIADLVLAQYPGTTYDNLPRQIILPIEVSADSNWTGANIFYWGVKLCFENAGQTSPFFPPVALSNSQAMKQVEILMPITYLPLPVGQGQNGHSEFVCYITDQLFDATTQSPIYTPFGYYNGGTPSPTFPTALATRASIACVAQFGLSCLIGAFSPGRVPATRYKVLNAQILAMMSSNRNDGFASFAEGPGAYTQALVSSQSFAYLF